MTLAEENIILRTALAYIRNRRWTPQDQVVARAFDLLDSPRINVTEMRKTTSDCPSQWEGTTVDGKDVYVRYRWGSLRIEVDNKVVYSGIFGDGLDGYMEYSKLKTIATELISWPEIEK